MSFTVLHLESRNLTLSLGDHAIYIPPPEPDPDEIPNLGVVLSMGNADWLGAVMSGVVIDEGVSITPPFDPGDDHIIVLQHTDLIWHSYVNSGGVFAFDDTWLADHSVTAVPAPEAITFDKMVFVMQDGVGLDDDTVADTRVGQLYIFVEAGPNYSPYILSATPMPPEQEIGAIDTLTDVDTTTDSPDTGDFLGWDGTNWVPTTIEFEAVDDEPPATDLDGLTDVVITAVTELDGLIYQGGTWENVPFQDIFDGFEIAPKSESTTWVTHGATASTPRPDGWGRVVWIGTVEPDNWLSDIDEWIDPTP